MRRKIIKQGAATLTLSLPAKWAKELNLKPGDELEVEEQNKALYVSSAARPRKQEITVELTEQNKHDLQPILTHLYRRGFDVIKVKGVSSGTMSAINSIVKDQLLGFEITERDGRQCTITNISEPTDEKYDVLLRRVFLIIKETQTLVKQDFKTGKFENLKEIEELRKQQDKFVYFSLRVITREKKPSTEWELLKSLMNIEHAYYYLYAYATEHPVKNSRILELMEELEKYFQLYYDAFYKKDVTAIHKMNKQKTEFQFGKCYRYLEQSKGKETVVLSQIREIFRLMQTGASPILSELFQAKLG